jgi:hypothetical protein
MQNIFDKYFEQLTAEVTLTLRRSLSYPDGANGVGSWLPFFSEKFFRKAEEKYILAEAGGAVEGWNNTNTGLQQDQQFKENEEPA